MASDNKTGGGAASTAAGGGRLVVDDDEVKNDRTRFEIDLKYGETTIVSWVKLLQDSGISSPEPQKWLHQEDESRIKCSNIVLKKEKDNQNYISEVTKNTIVGHARVKSITLTRHISEEHSLNNERIVLPDLNVPYTVQAASSLPTHTKDESSGMVNGSMLERTILEMETMVADSRRLHGDVQDAHHSVASKRKLPRELKQKLETVARLAHSSQGRISDELIMRLVSILGHWLKPKTLKRCLREMVPSDISACGGEAVSFSQIKKEVVEMIRLRNPLIETKDGSGNETMELDAAKYSMDDEMEDKICDFYDIYVQGMDQIKSSEIRKFYIQLAALWPKGTMDNHGVRNAICRSKERRRTVLQEKGHEKSKRKNTSTAGLDDDLHGEAKLVADPERPLNDTNAPVLTFPDTAVPGTPELDQNLRQRKFDILNETT